MQIQSILGFLYFKTIEKEINKILDQNQHILVGHNYEEEKTPIDFGKYNKYIESFIETFKNNFSEEQFDNMMYLLRNLKIKEQDVLINNQLIISLGHYDSYTNEIILNNYKDAKEKINIKEVIYHELLHMASTRTISNGALTGFAIPDVLGSNLNEGYTEYLTRKYYTRGYKYVDSNENDVIIAKGIENIIGQEKMQKYYFNADLASIINELSEYSPRKEVIKLLFLIDTAPIMGRKGKEFDNIIKEIARLNKVKLDKELEEGLIDIKTYEEEFVIKVKEYRNYQMWSEDTEIIDNGDSFILQDHDYQSSEINRWLSKEKQYQKK